MHPLRQLVLRDRVADLPRVGGVPSGKPGLLLFRETPFHGELLAGLADLGFEGALVALPFEIERIFVNFLSIQHLVFADLVDVLHAPR